MINVCNFDILPSICLVFSASAVLDHITIEELKQNYFSDSQYQFWELLKYTFTTYLRNNKIIFKFFNFITTSFTYRILHDREVLL